MKILMVHNHYQQFPGGEDIVFDAEAALLRENGHEVYTYVRHNNELKEMSPLRRAGTAIWCRASYQAIRRLIREIHPDVVHFHNSFVVISPAAFHAAKAEGIPVVLTIHNYRFLCPNALFFRNDQVCEDCSGRYMQWPGVLHACYRGSRSASSVVALMNSFHKAIGTWEDKIDIYIALTEFARQKFIQAGFPGEKITVKPNFVSEDHNSERAYLKNERREGALFVGRLSQEKGIVVLLEAWERLEKNIPLTIIGDGPLSDAVLRAVGRTPWVRWLGQQSSEDTIRIMGEAAFFLLPSICYEGMPRTIIEAFMQGTPPITSDLGAMRSMIENGRTGLLCDPGNPDDLATKVNWAVEHPEEMARMGRAARIEYEAKFTAAQNYRMLLSIYRAVINNSA